MKAVLVSVTLAVAASLSIAGAGMISARPLPSFRYQPAHAHVPSCTHAGKAVGLPARFPVAFPFPPGTLLNYAQTRTTRTHPLLKGQVAVYGFVPSRGFAVTVTFFKREVPRAGFVVKSFQADAPHDSEGIYRGHGSQGIWQLRSLPACPGAMAIGVSAQAAP